MRADKQLLLDEVINQIEQRSSFVIMRYTGLDANKTSTFRRQIAEMGGNVEMVKKKILVKAAQEAGFDLNVKELPGHISLVFAGKDAVQTTKAVYQLKKDNDQAIQVLGGRFDGQLYNANQVEMLSQLPGKDEMRAQLLGLFVAPMSQTVSVMNTLLCSVLHCLENKAKEESSS